MLGISFAEFLLIILIAVLVIPVKNWPDVARFLARAVKYVKNIFTKITDTIDDVKQQIDLEKPIDEIIEKSKIDTFSTKIPTNKKRS